MYNLKAMGEGLCLMLTCKSSRSPADDRLSHILFSADHDGEDKQYDCGVSVIYSVKEIVIPPSCKLSHTRDSI